MNAFPRVVLAFVTAVATFYFTFWVGSALLVPLKLPLRVMGWGMTAVSALLAIAAARSVWRRSSAGDGLLSSVLTGALVTGAIGFCLGFFGPIVFSPGANQGPLLGLFITGPAGFVLGALGGWVKWAARRAREQSPPPLK